MSVKVQVNVSKSAEPAVHDEARVTATQMIAALREVAAEAEAAGLNIRVTMKHVGKATPAVKAAPVVEPAPAWPADLADPRWRP